MLSHGWMCTTYCAPPRPAAQGSRATSPAVLRYRMRKGCSMRRSPAQTRAAGCVPLAEALDSIRWRTTGHGTAPRRPRRTCGRRHGTASGAARAYVRGANSSASPIARGAARILRGSGGGLPSGRYLRVEPLRPPVVRHTDPRRERAGNGPPCAPLAGAGGRSTSSRSWPPAAWRVRHDVAPDIVRVANNTGDAAGARPASPGAAALGRQSPIRSTCTSRAGGRASGRTLASAGICRRTAVT